VGLTQEIRGVAPNLVLHFLQRTFPFSELETSTLETLSRQCVIEHYPKGTLILKQNITDVEHFHIIQKGGVKAYLSSEDTLVTLKDYSSEGDSFGALPIVSGQKADFNIEAVDDTFCFLIDKDIFLSVVRDNPRFGRYYLETFSEDFVTAVYSELRFEQVKSRKEEACYLFSYRVSDIIKQSPEIIEGWATIRRAAQRMAALHIDSLLVKDDTDAIAGIVSNKDFRTKVVAQGLDYDLPVESIMTSPLRTIPAQAPCFEAMLRMIREQVGHLAVEHRQVIVGVVSDHDIMVHQGASFYYHFREIRGPRSISGLYPISQKIPIIVRTLLEEGARAENITKVITLFSDNIRQRMLTLLAEEMGPAPVPFCWLVLGSEGRKEQTFRTDQDNALVYQDPDGEAESAAARGYFKTFASKAVEHLQALGYPKCKNRFMASNPRWCRPYSVWQGYFQEWIQHPIPPEIGLSRIFFDFRPAWGANRLGDELRYYVTDLARDNLTFMRQHAVDCLTSSVPVSFCGDYVVERDGRQSAHLDLKAQGLTPIVNFARLMALNNGVRETSTLGRLQVLNEQGLLSKELYAEAKEAYEYQIQLTLVHQLRMLESGETADNTIRPAELSDLEKKTLREAFAVIQRMLDKLKKDFLTGEPARR
jgi:CBS domain-containing protein